jgi:hypothetical protein
MVMRGSLKLKPRLAWVLVLTVVGSLMIVPLAAYGRGGPPDHAHGRPPLSPPVGPPLSPPVGPPLSPPVGPPLSPPPHDAYVDVPEVGSKAPPDAAVSPGKSGKAPKPRRDR